jgi:ABC-type glycerol-3-phosphate transport system permease component
VRSLRRALTPALLYVILLAGSVPILIPFAWMVATSLKTRELAAEKSWLPVKETSRLTRTGSPPESVVVQVEGADGRV